MYKRQVICYGIAFYKQNCKITVKKTKDRIVEILAPWAAKGGIGPAAQEHLLAVLAQAQGLVTVHQHEAEHHLDAQQQRMEDVYKRQPVRFTGANFRQETAQRKMESMKKLITD